MEQRAFTALGGDCELFGIDVDAGALERGEAWIHRMHDRLTRFSDSSELSRFNASAGAWVAVSEELEALLRESLRAYEVSGGLVHAATLPALLAAGYTRDFTLGGTPTTATPAPPAPLPELLEVRAGRRGSRGARRSTSGASRRAGSPIGSPRSWARTAW